MRTRAIALAALCLLAACEKASHSNIDKWRGTERGPEKLAAALKDGGLDADLRAHAGEVLVSMDRTGEVVSALAAMRDGERAAVLERLVPRLWNDCKLLDELQKPTEKQLRAKDALFSVRDLTTEAVRGAVDGYLLDWLAGYYEGRALLGAHHGEKIVRALGPAAAPKLLAAARRVLDDPGTDKEVAVLGDELLKGLAVTSAPDAVGFLLDLAERSHADATLQTRAMGALYFAYVEEPASGRKGAPELGAQLGRLQAMAASTSQPGENANAAFDLVVAAGADLCLPVLAALARHAEEARRLRAVQLGLECAGAGAIRPMAEALPPELGYERGILEKYVWNKMVELGPGAAAPARALLASKSWVARWTGIEVLRRLGDKGDVAALRALAGDGARARGFFGSGSGSKSKSGRRPEPTLGALATEAANELEK